MVLYVRTKIPDNGLEAAEDFEIIYFISTLRLKSRKNYGMIDQIT